jgi:hypothetical protein
LADSPAHTFLGGLTKIISFLRIKNVRGLELEASWMLAVPDEMTEAA